MVVGWVAEVGEFRQLRARSAHLDVNDTPLLLRYDHRLLQLSLSRDVVFHFPGWMREKRSKVRKSKGLLDVDDEETEMRMYRLVKVRCWLTLREEEEVGRRKGTLR